MTKIEELEALKAELVSLSVLQDEDSDALYYRLENDISRLSDSDLVSLNTITSSYTTVIETIADYIEYLRGKDVSVTDVVLEEAYSGALIKEDIKKNIVDEDEVAVIIEDTSLSSILSYPLDNFNGNIEKITITSNISILKKEDNSSVSFKAKITKINVRNGSFSEFQFNENDQISLIIPKTSIEIDDIYIVSLKIVDIITENTTLVMSAKVDIHSEQTVATEGIPNKTAYIGSRFQDERVFKTPSNEADNRGDFWCILGKKGIIVTLTAASNRNVEIMIGEERLNIGGLVENDIVTKISILGKSISIANLLLEYRPGRGYDFEMYSGKYHAYSIRRDASKMVILKNVVPFDSILRRAIHEL